jgi:hypothetical protein
MTDLTADELEYLRREQAKFQFYRKIEAKQQDSVRPADASSVEPPVDSPQPA